MKVMHVRAYVLPVVSVVMLNSFVLPTSAQNLADQFQESTPSGLQVAGDSFGAAWGDLNNDKCPDLWFNHHGDLPPYLFLNDCRGGFANLMSQVYPNYPWTDGHGAQWADIDNDGDQDLLQISGQNRIFINEAGIFSDRTTDLGLKFTTAGMAPLSVDWNRDGWLDLLYMPLTNPNIRFMQSDGKVFANETVAYGLSGFGSVFFSQISDVDNDNIPDMLIQNNHVYPAVVYKGGSKPFANIKSSLGVLSATSVRDAIIADFNNDRRMDMLMVRGYNAFDNSGADTSDVQAFDSSTLRSFIHVRTTEIGKLERGFSFKSSGIVTFSVYKQSGGVTNQYPLLTDVHIGSTGYHPVSWPFVLDPADPSNHGIKPHIVGNLDDHGLYIGYDPVSERWTYTFNRSIPQDYAYVSRIWDLRTIISSTAPISAVQRVNFNDYKGLPAKFFVQSDTGWADQSAAFAAGASLPCGSAVSGDFDNDMDLDVFMLCSTPSTNLPNRLFDNQGDGTFSEVALGGGAEGTRLGIGDTVSTVDYDGDGFLDLLLMNGAYPDPIAEDGPIQMFRNQGNGNKWIQIDLEGVLSNRDGIGAKVTAVNGNIYQTRERNGGMHNRTQDHPRLHFGLAGNTKVDQLAIHWPSGIVQTLPNVPANQLLHVIEPVVAEPLGKPAYTPGVSEGVYLWKDDASGQYHVRVSDATAATYTIKLLSSEALPDLADPVGAAEWSPATMGFTVKFAVNGEEKGLDFSVPAEARVMIAVEKDGKPNPRLLHVGASGRPISPAGWIKWSGALPVRPSDTETGVSGLMIGRSVRAGSRLEAYWRADDNTHAYRFALLASEPLMGFAKTGFESGDLVTTNGEAIEVTASGASNWDVDGLRVILGAPSEVGIAFQQDGLLPPHKVNTAIGGLGMPNAYWLQNGF